MTSLFTLENKTILVTGASSGIGQSVAIECSKMGASVVITGRDEYRLKNTLNKLEGDNHQMIVADILKNEDVLRLVDDCPLIDGISHNAGISKVAPIKFLSKDDYESIFRTNAIGPIQLTQMLLKKKKIKKNGSIVFTSSLSGIHCIHYGESAYATSKAAISGFAKGSALELATNYIRVNCVNPGIIITPVYDKLPIYSKEQLEEKIKDFPLKRLGGPTDVSWAIIYFLSDASAWVTGNDFKIDGGYTLI